MRRLIAAILVGILPSIALPQVASGKQTVSDLSEIRLKPRGAATSGALADHVSGWVNVKTAQPPYASGAKGDGVTDDAAAINAAITASTSSSVHRVYFPAGTYIVGASVLVPTTAPIALVGAGMDATILKLKSGANVDVITQSNFASLTGTSSSAGVFHVKVTDLTVDGNRAANSSGWGIRLYGRAVLFRNIMTQNCASGSQWSEGHDTGAFASQSDDLESLFLNMKHVNSGGSGFVFKGPHDSRIINQISWGHTLWGSDYYSAATVHGEDTYLNGSGGCRINSGGSVFMTASTQSTASGWGILVDTGAGVNVFSGTIATGPVALEVRAPNTTFNGQIFSSGLTVGETLPPGVGGSYPGAAIRINGGSLAFTGSINAPIGNVNGSGWWFDLVNETPPVSIVAVTTGGLGSTGLINGTPQAQGTWILSGNQTYVQMPSRTVRAGGWAPQLPLSNSAIPAVDLTQTWTKSQTFSGAAIIPAAIATAYSASISVDASLGNLVSFAVTNGTAFNINLPTNPTSGQDLTYVIRNRSGGVMGAITWGSGFEVAGWTNPANGFQRSITFTYIAGFWKQTFVSAVDVATAN